MAAIISEEDYKRHASEGLNGLEHLSRQEQRACLSIRMKVALAAFESRPGGEEWRVLQTFICAYQTADGPKTEKR
jgi:hypothetical protein